MQCVCLCAGRAPAPLPSAPLAPLFNRFSLPPRLFLRPTALRCSFPFLVIVRTNIVAPPHVSHFFRAQARSFFARWWREVRSKYSKNGHASSRLDSGLVAYIMYLNSSITRGLKGWVSPPHWTVDFTSSTGSDKEIYARRYYESLL